MRMTIKSAENYNAKYKNCEWYLKHTNVKDDLIV